MAEEMANASTKKACKPISGSTTKGSGSARKREPKKAPELVTVAPETKENPEANEAPGSGDPKCESAELNLDLHGRMKEAIAKRFPEIIRGLMLGISQGKPGGAKVLFDALEQLKSDPDTTDVGSDSGLSILDLIDPEFDWEGLVNAGKRADGETPKAGIDAGIDSGPDIHIASCKPE
jgi:hypothetical protein